MINENYLTILKAKYLLKKLWLDKFYGKITTCEYNKKKDEICYSLKLELYDYINFIYIKRS